MSSKNGSEDSPIVHECVQKLTDGRLAPWKVEEDLEITHSVPIPDNYRLASLCRRRYIQSLTGEKFQQILLPDTPYKKRYYCAKDDLALELDARDRNLTCSLCGADLIATDQFAPLVANYVGGQDDYFSYAGQVNVKGDVRNTFTNLLVYGTGLGPIGVTRGSYVLNKLGGAEVHVEDLARAVRCLGLRFLTEDMRQKAQAVIEAFVPEATSVMQDQMSEFCGQISSVDFDHAEARNGLILYVEFVAEFSNFRGHGDISRAVGFIKRKVEEKLLSQEIAFEMSVIAQGHDGDLKPSPRNKRGRKTAAQIKIPLSDFEPMLKVDPDKFLSFVEIDAIGAQRLGCPFYSGMGGEIIPAVYKATKVNPHSPLVSCFQNIFARKERGDIVYQVELPNVEVGVVSSREGLRSPVGREAMRIMGIKSAKDFSACVAAQVLAGEFNLALEISREKLYS